ncbi:MAG TPA: methyltransferase domain-containing protein [Xanthobacteraceae bacterium]|nr:methyltransferase domain-containing protein [Xanthobacteraceae bacterium]
MTLARRIEDEWLDALPADDPRAVRARRDLRRVNAWALLPGIVARALVKHAPERPRRLLDLGTGDGSFMLEIARRLASRWPGVTATLLDRQDIVSPQIRAAFAALSWNVETVTADVFDFLGDAQSPTADVITSNLFLHHFSEDRLAGLFARAAPKCILFLACEPRRAKFTVRASRMLWAIGCADVIVHDAVASARAGFNDRELSALWPGRSDWDLDEHPSGLFTHSFVARRTLVNR